MKKTIAWLMAFLMGLSLLPVAAFAEEPAETPVTEQAAPAPAKEEPAPEAKAETSASEKAEPQAKAAAPEQPATEAKAAAPEQPAEGTAEEIAAEQADPAAPAEEPAEEPAEREAEPLETEASAEAEPAYPWSALDDDALLAYIRAAKNEARLRSLLQNKNGAEYAAFMARVEAIADRSAREEALAYLQGLTAQTTAPTEAETAQAAEKAAEPQTTAPAEAETAQAGEEAEPQITAPAEAEPQADPEEPIEKDAPQTIPEDPAEGEELPEDEAPFDEEPDLDPLGEADDTVPTSGKCGDAVTWAFDAATKTLTVSGTGSMWDFDAESNVPEWKTYNLYPQKVVFEGRVETVGDHAFDQIRTLKSIRFSDGITAIGAHAFDAQSRLEDIAFPARLTTVGDGAFERCEIENVYLPWSITKIGSSAFPRESTGLWFDMTKTEFRQRQVSVGSGNSAKRYYLIAHGECGPNAKYKIDHIGNLTVYGTGSTYDFDPTKNLPPWVNLGASLRGRSVIIEEGITRLGENAFNCSKGDDYPFTSFIPADSLEEIGAGVFEGCEKLRSVESMNGVRSIGKRAFYGCAAMKTLPGMPSLETLGDEAFSGAGLTAVTLPDGLTSIGTDAFRKCEQLGSVDLGGCESILSGAFADCEQLSSVDLGGCKSIGSGAFANCGQLSSVDLGGCERILSEAFSNCGALKSIQLPETLKQIGSNAFEKSGLTSVKLPDGITELNSSVFANCKDLASADLNKCRKIGSSAFGGCEKLKEVRLPEEMESIGTYAFERTGLTSIRFPYGVNVADDFVCRNCANLASVDLNACKTMGMHAFQGCVKLKAITIPEEMDQIGEGAFMGCSSLKEVTFPSILRKIGESAFYGCKAIEKVRVNMPEADWKKNVRIDGFNDPLKAGSVRYYYSGEYGECGEKAYWLYERDTATLNVFGSGDIDFRGWNDCVNGKAVNVAIGDAITGICDGAFSDFAVLENVVFPAKLERIGASAFEGCVSLTEIELPKPVKTVGASAFAGCTALEGFFAFCSRLAEIPESCFEGDTALGNISLPRLLTAVGENAFNGCSALNAAVINMTAEEWESVAIGAGNDPLTAPGMILMFENPPQPDAGTLTLGQSYLLLNAGEWAPAIPAFLDGNPIDYVYWYAADENMAVDPASPQKNALISVEPNGAITAVPGTEGGTAYAVASLSKDPAAVNKAKTAFCRVDVLKENAAEDEKVSGVTVPADKVTTEVYKTDYTKLTLVLELKQNAKKLTGFDPDLLYPEDKAKKAAEDGAAVTAAKFTVDALNELFDLGIVDDRTLEIVPKDETIKRCLAGDKAIKGSYKTTLTVTVKGAEKPFETNAFTLTVKKTMPAVTAKPVRLNKVYLASEAGGCTEPIVLNADGVMLEEDPSKAVSVPDGLKLIPIVNDVELADENLKKGSYKLYLLASAEGWAVKKQITVPVTVMETYPAVKFDNAKLTLNPNVPADTDSTTVTVKLNNADVAEFFPVKTIRISEGKTDFEDPADCRSIKVNVEDGMVTVENGDSAPEDGKAHTYTVRLGIAGREYPFTVKVAEKAAKVGLTLKASGAINSKVPGSYATIVPALKNLNLTPTYDFKVEKVVGKAKTGEDVTDLFDVAQLPDAFRALVKEGKEAALESSVSYLLRVTASVEGEDLVTASVKIPVTIAKTAPRAAVALKVTGAIDTARPNTAVTVTPSFRNYFGYEWNPADVRVYSTAGKTRVDETANFVIGIDDRVESFVIRAKDAEKLDPAKKYSAVFKAAGTELPEKTAPIRVTMGAAKFTASVSGSLYDNDRYSAVTAAFKTADTTLSAIEKIVLTGKNADSFRMVDFGSDTYMIGYRDYESPFAKPGKQTVTAEIFLAGNGTAKPNARLKLTF